MTLAVRTAAASDLRAVSRIVQDKVAQLDPIMPMSALRLGQDQGGPELDAMRLGARISMVLERFLIGVRVIDAPTFVGVAVVLTAIAVLASLLPTRRATRVDPTVTLKCE